MFAICLAGQSKSHGQAQSQFGRRQGRWTFESITVTIYRSGFAKPAAVPVQAWKDPEEGISGEVALCVRFTWEHLGMFLVWLWYQMVPESDMIYQGPHTPKLSPSHPHTQPLSLKEALVRDSILVAGEGWAMKWLVYFYLPPSLCP